MGKWNNRRWMPRNKYRDQTPPSPPPPPRRYQYRTQSYLRAVLENSDLSWEEKFCILAGVPWQRIVVAKRYMYCHDNVVKWNDSAGEEAFYKAKKRFWAAINGLPCDASLPNPDMYIDEIDWNPEIDPNLILELDKEFFNPDEAEKVNEETTNRKVHNSVPGRALGRDSKNPGNSDSPWECSQAQGTGALKDVAHGWNQWDDSVKLENLDNPWEHNYPQGDGALKDNAWEGCGDKSWGWNQGLNYTMQSKKLDNNCSNRWDRGGQGGGFMKEKGWGDVGNNSCGWNHWDTSGYESRNLVISEIPWETHPSGAPKDRRWRDCGNNSWGWKQWENQFNEPKHLEPTRPSGSGNSGCRKREGSQQHTLRYKSLRFQGEDSGIGHQWGKGRTQKRVSFVHQ